MDVSCALRSANRVLLEPWRRASLDLATNGTMPLSDTAFISRDRCHPGQPGSFITSLPSSHLSRFIAPPCTSRHGFTVNNGSARCNLPKCVSPSAMNRTVATLTTELYSMQGHSCPRKTRLVVSSISLWVVFVERLWSTWLLWFKLAASDLPMSYIRAYVKVCIIRSDKTRAWYPTWTIICRHPTLLHSCLCHGLIYTEVFPIVW